MPTSKEKLSDGGKNRGEKEKIPPLSLNTPDLTPGERDLIESALHGPIAERLAKEQIDRMFAEDPDLQKAAEGLPPLPWGEEVPKEEEMLHGSNQKHTTEEKSVSPDSAGVGEKLRAWPGEFKTMPLNFIFYAKWLSYVERHFSNQTMFQSLPQETKQVCSETGKLVRSIEEKMKAHIVPDEIMMADMASAINAWIRLLGEIGVPDAELSRKAFRGWFAKQHMGQGGAAGI